MSSAAPLHADQQVEAAIARVLEHERRAKEAVARCEQDAAAIVRRAREQARRVAERADARINAVHMTCTLDTARRLGALRAAAAEGAAPAAPTAAQLERLDHAVRILAARLSGEG
jgi:vacuolar-type H+-ATPase subunit H